MGGFIEYRGEWQSPIIDLSERWKLCESCLENVRTLFPDTSQSYDISEDESGNEGDDRDELPGFEKASELDGGCE